MNAYKSESFRGAQAASLHLPGACRQQFRDSELSFSTKPVSASCRNQQAGSMRSPERDARNLEIRLPSRTRPDRTSDNERGHYDRSRSIPVANNGGKAGNPA